MFAIVVRVVVRVIISYNISCDAAARLNHALAIVTCVLPSLISWVFSLDMGALMASAKYKSVYGERIKSVLNEVNKAAGDGGPGVNLFIDELQVRRLERE